VIFQKKMIDKRLSVRESEVALRAPREESPRKFPIMKTPASLILLSCLLITAVTAEAQEPKSAEQITRPRLVASNGSGQSNQANQEPAIPKPSPARPVETAKPVSQSPPEDPRPVAREENNKRLSPNRLRIRLREAERLVKARPLPTSLTPSIEYVTVAALLPETSQIHLVRIAKETFLAKGSEVNGVSSLGLPVQVRILRANGVNTAITIFADHNRSLVPLLVEFPIERRGVFREMAYYTSAHPALLSPELMKTGQLYVDSMVDLAARRLRDRGNPIAPNLVEIAKRLSIVEHTDHDRFRNENRIALFEEIYTLYALNELDTYRYSVSSAGAGGMVQMIPWTYALMRQRHPGVGLNPDFVAGMRNHGNALEAMLLYMQDTWNDLSADEDVQNALTLKQATVPDLVAAGYNSNAAKIPGYVRRGGAAWRTLIPRETQIYLQIYQSLETLMRAKQDHAGKKAGK
jgi:hypothetical protein